jgi:uncharacterized protein YkwD
VKFHLLITLLLLAGCAEPPPVLTPNKPTPPPVAPAPEPEPEPPHAPDSPQAMLAVLHNQARLREHDSPTDVEPLWMESRLTVAAQKHADWMAQNRKMSHTGIGGSSAGDRIYSEGYSWTAAGENVAMGYRSPDAVFQGWMNSPGHRRNILSSKYTEVGFGIASGGGKTYWCAVFASPRKSRVLELRELPEVDTPDGIEDVDVSILTRPVPMMAR